MPKRDWDARLYHQISNPQRSWGGAVLDRLHLQGGETVMDAGCGSGRVTTALVERLPHGNVIAVDASPTMLDEARVALAGFGDRVRFVLTDLVEVDGRIGEQVDAVFSTATFHWISDHLRLFGAIHRSLRPGGQLVAQCGGTGNVQSVIEAGDTIARDAPYRQFLADIGPWHHRASPEDTASLLAQAGFEGVRTWLEPSPQEFADRAAFEIFLRAVVMRPQMDRLPADLAEAYTSDVVNLLEQHGYVLDYVRLNIDARRPPA